MLIDLTRDKKECLVKDNTEETSHLVIKDENISLASIAISQWELKAKSIGIQILGLGFDTKNNLLCTNMEDIISLYGIYSWQNSLDREQILIDWSSKV